MKLVTDIECNCETFYWADVSPVHYPRRQHAWYPPHCLPIVLDIVMKAAPQT